MFTPVTARSANAYKRVAIDSSVQSASSHQMIVLLFDELLLSLSAARHALQKRDISAKVHQVSRALRILDEGLKAPLDLEAGGDLGRKLRSLYDYCSWRLVQANAQNDDAGLQEVATLIGTIADGWKQIGGSHGKSTT